MYYLWDFIELYCCILASHITTLNQFSRHSFNIRGRHLKRLLSMRGLSHCKGYSKRQLPHLPSLQIILLLVYISLNILDQLRLSYVLSGCFLGVVETQAETKNKLLFSVNHLDVYRKWLIVLQNIAAWFYRLLQSSTKIVSIEKVKLILILFYCLFILIKLSITYFPIWKFLKSGLDYMLETDAAAWLCVSDA